MSVCSSLLWTFFLYLPSLLTPSFHCRLLCASPGGGRFIWTASSLSFSWLHFPWTLSCTLAPCLCAVLTSLCLFFMIPPFLPFSPTLFFACLLFLAPAPFCSPSRFSLSLPDFNDVIPETQRLDSSLQKARAQLSAKGRRQRPSRSRLRDSVSSTEGDDTLDKKVGAQMLFTYIAQELLVQPVIIFYAFYTNNMVVLTSA